MKTLVQHWRFEDGKTRSENYGGNSRVVREPIPRGWYCWVYPTDDQDFVGWMERLCPTADVVHRFNSGNPMYTVYISDDQEATLFQLKWR
jgi:hypothetical protein